MVNLYAKHCRVCYRANDSPVTCDVRSDGISSQGGGLGAVGGVQLALGVLQPLLDRAFGHADRPLAICYQPPVPGAPCPAPSSFAFVQGVGGFRRDMAVAYQRGQRVADLSSAIFPVRPHEDPGMTASGIGAVRND